MLMTNQQAAKLSQPGIGSFNNPAALITAKFASIFVSPCLVVVPVRHDQLYAAFLQALTQRVRVIAAIRNYSLRPLPRAAFRPGDADLGQRGFRKLNFSRRGTFQPNSQRKTLTVDQYHPLCALAALGFTDSRAPFFAGAKLPSRKLSSHLSKPSASSAPSRARHAANQTPSCCQRCSLRQQVAGEGNWSGRKCQAAPVRRIHRMPSKQARFGAGGRPRLSRRSFGLGNKGSISSHCSSVDSFCRFFMAKAHQLTALNVST